MAFLSSVLLLGTSLAAHSEDAKTPQAEAKPASAVSGVKAWPTDEEVAAEGWEYSNDDDGVRVWRRDVEGSRVVAFRGETVIDAPIAKVVSVLDDTSRRLEWVHSAKETRKIRQVGTLERVEYNHTGAPWPVRDRDFVYLAKIALDRTLKQVRIAIHSVADEAMPEADCCVRGEIAKSLYILTSVENGTKTHITVEVNADPKGAIPKFIANIFQKSWPRKTLLGVKRQVQKEDVKPLKMVEDYFEGKPVAGVDTPAVVKTTAK